MGQGQSANAPVVPTDTKGGSTSTFNRSLFPFCASSPAHAPCALGYFLILCRPRSPPPLSPALLRSPCPTGTGPEVILNIYEPVDEKSRGAMGFGVYHTGVQIGSTEYAYGGGSVSASGVYTQTPCTAPPGSNWQFKMSQSLGRATVDSIKLKMALDKLARDFAADKYDVLANNCNHYTEAVATAVGVAVNYPSWVNRAAKYGQKFRGIYDPTAAGGGAGGGGAQTVTAQPPPKSVFETSKGHSLADPAPAAGGGATFASVLGGGGGKPPAGGSGFATPPAPSGPAGGPAAAGARRNPWADKGFKPPGNAVPAAGSPAGAASPAAASGK